MGKKERAAKRTSYSDGQKESKDGGGRRRHTDAGRCRVSNFRRKNKRLSRAALNHGELVVLKEALARTG